MAMLLRAARAEPRQLLCKSHQQQSHRIAAALGAFSSGFGSVAKTPPQCLSLHLGLCPVQELLSDLPTQQPPQLDVNELQITALNAPMARQKGKCKDSAKWFPLGSTRCRHSLLHG